MIIQTKNNEYVFVNNNDEFIDLVQKEIGDDAKEYMAEMASTCEAYEELDSEYETLSIDYAKLEEENEELKRKAESNVNEEYKSELNCKILDIIHEVRRLKSVSKSKKVLEVEADILSKLNDLLFE